MENTTTRKSNITVFMVVKDILKKRTLCENVIAHAAKISDTFFIVDHGSSDGTADFLNKLADIHDFKLEVVREELAAGNMDEMKWKYYQVLKDRKLSGQWREYIFILDWDEVLSEKLVEEISKTELVHDVYLVYRETFFLGKPIDKWVQLPLLFRPEWAAVWAFKKVHDLYRIYSKNVGKFSAPLLHYSFENVAELIQKTRYYWEIEWRERARNFPDDSRIFTGIKLLFIATLYFGYSLIKYWNFRHIPGWVFASWMFCSYMMQYMFYLEEKSD